jgi:Ca2+-binding RTX toxin-like protein
MASKYFKASWSGNNLKAEINALVTSHNVTNVAGGPQLVGDFNGDGSIDFLSVFFEFAPNIELTRPTHGRIAILAGDGEGRFTDATNSILGEADFPYSVRKLAVADLNGDGRDDVAMVVNREDGRATTDPNTNASQQVVLLSAPGGVLELVTLDMTTWGHAFGVGDLNGDQRADLILGGFTLPEGQTDSATAAFLQRPDGSLSAPSYLGDLSGLSLAVGDFDGDGTNELADYYTDYSLPLWSSGLRVVDLNPDGSRGSTSVNLIMPERMENGQGWNGPSTFVVRLDAQGNEYVDQGIHDLKVGDLNGDGRDDIVGIRFGFSMNYVDGVLTEGGDPRNALELFALGQDGFEPMKDAWIKGWHPAIYGVQDVKLIDFNGDGHLDLFVPWPFDTEDDKGVGVRLFLNDGAARFTRVKQALLPDATDLYAIFTMKADAIDANGDGIMDIMMAADGFDTSWSSWTANSETLFLGTKRFYTGPKYTDPALKGAAGFNEQYYLNTYADAAKAVKKHKFDDGLDHYLEVGAKKGYLGFATNTHIFGSDKNDTMKAREGHERLDGGLGKDTLTGKSGADEFVFSTKLGPSNVDTIKDFRPGQGDTIGLDRDIFKKVGAALGEDEFFAKKGAAKAHDRDDRIIYDTKTGKLYYDDDGSKKGGHDAVHFATLGNKPLLDAGDFNIV